MQGLLEGYMDKLKTSKNVGICELYTGYFRSGEMRGSRKNEGLRSKFYN